VPAGSGAEVAGSLAVSGKESSSSPPTMQTVTRSQTWARVQRRAGKGIIDEHGDLELDELYEAVWSPPVLTDGRRHSHIDDQAAGQSPPRTLLEIR
jgi:hypothetical protein